MQAKSSVVCQEIFLERVRPALKWEVDASTLFCEVREDELQRKNGQ